ncbi:MAG TPA: hypothetical protein VKW04_04150 [Planctomycetota bacterium]|nr:hypothetical protein [Planctomycetota bacterium]
MGLKTSAQAGVAALVLLLAGALGVRSWRATPALPPPPPDSAKSADPAPAPAAAPASLGDLTGSPTGTLALRWRDLLAKSQEKSRLSASDQELLRSQEREFAQEMKKRLSQDPARWNDVLDFLSSEDPRIGRRILAGLKDGVTDAAEPGLIRSLKNGTHREIRISSASLLAERPSSEALWALVTSAQEDPDSGVRYKSLSELATRQGRATTPAESTTIDALLRQRARVDPDPVVRQFALRVTGQEETTGPPNPSSPDRRPIRQH